MKKSKPPAPRPLAIDARFTHDIDDDQLAEFATEFEDLMEKFGVDSVKAVYLATDTWISNEFDSFSN